MSSLSTLVVLGTFVLLVEHALATWRAARAPETRRAWVLEPALACVLAFVLRAFLVPPSFTHDNFHASELVDTMLGDAAANPRVTSYGPVGFVLLGTLASWLGPSTDTIFAANLVLSVVALALFGVFFARIYGRPRVVTFTVLAGSLLPPLARVAHSEDLHALAAFYAGSGLLHLDRFARDRKIEDAVLSLVATTAMLYTRQTFIAFVPCAVLFAFARHDVRALVRDRRVLLLVGLLAVIGVVRVGQSLVDPTDAGSFAAIAFGFHEPRIVLTMLARHWFLAPDRLGFVLVPLAALGTWVAGRTRFAVVHAAVSVFLFVLTLTFDRPNPGSELCMRSPFTYVVLGTVALGATRLASGFARRGLHDAVVAGIVGVLLVVAPTFTPWSRAYLAYQSIEYQEYAYVASVVTRLPRRFTLIEPPRDEGSTRVRLPVRVFELAGRAVRRVDTVEAVHAGDDVLLFEGLNCWAYSAFEIYGLTRWDREHMSESARMRRMVDEVFLGVREPSVRVPDAMRPACAELVRSGRPLDLEAGRLVPHTVAPFAHFGRTGPLPLRFHRIDVGATRRDQRTTGN